MKKRLRMKFYKRIGLVLASIIILLQSPVTPVISVSLDRNVKINENITNNRNNEKINESITIDRRNVKINESITIDRNVIKGTELKLLEPIQRIMNSYKGYDINADGTKEINSMETVAQCNTYKLTNENRMVLVLVEPRLLKAPFESDILPLLVRYSSDLRAEGLVPRFVKADVYNGTSHQDGRTVLAIREFFKSVKAEYPKFEGAIMIGNFPEAMLVRRWIWKRQVPKGGMTIGGTKYNEGTWYLRIVPELISHRADLVLGDLDGNWKDIYVKGPDTIQGIEAVPESSMGSDWPKNNTNFKCKKVNVNNHSFQDYFYIRDDNITITDSNVNSYKFDIFTAQRHPEMNSSDKGLPNPLARPEIFISAINPKHIAVNPDPNFKDKNGKGFLGTDGKPQTVEAKSSVDLNATVFWKQDQMLEKRILIDFFNRNHLYRRGSYSDLPFRTASVGKGLSASSLNNMLVKASSDFAAPIIKEDAKLTDYVAWLKNPAVLRGVAAHSNSQLSEFGNNYNVSDLEAAVGGKPWRWEKTGSGYTYKPSLASQNGVADFYVHKTIWENNLLKNNGAYLYVHIGCEANSPSYSDYLPYNNKNYGTFQNAEGILFYLNGLAILTRAKVFYDSPTGLAEALKKSERASFGSGWKEYFNVEAQNADLASKVADNKRCYTWSVLGDWTVRLAYQNGIGIFEYKNGKITDDNVNANNAWMDSWNYNFSLNQVVTAGDFDGDKKDEFVITSDWGIGILKQYGDSLTPLMMMPKDTWFGNWRYNASVNTGKDVIHGSGDFDGDGKDELLLTSSWGIGLLKLNKDTLNSVVSKPKDTWFGGWRYNATVNTGNDKIHAIADFDGDGKDEILVTSSWGIGILKLQGDTFISVLAKPNNTWFGAWRYNMDVSIAGNGDFDGDGGQDILVRSAWGIGILKLANTDMTTLLAMPNDTWFGPWRYGKANLIRGIGDMDGDKKDEILISSDWGIGLFKLSGTSLSALVAKPEDTWFGQWRYNAKINSGKDQILSIKDFDGDGREDILIKSSWGIGILKLVNDTFSSISAVQNGSHIGRWILKSQDAFPVTGNMDGSNGCEIVIKR